MTASFHAALWMIGSIASFTTMAIAGRTVSAELDTFEIMLFRSVVGLSIMVVVTLTCGRLHDIRTQRLGLHVLRNMAHFAGQNLWFFALSAIPLAQVFALEFTTPIWVIILSPLLLREKITVWGALAALLGFIGVLIVTRPDGDMVSMGVVSAALAAIGFALTAIATRKLTRTESILSILFWLTLIQLIFGAGFAGFDGSVTIPSERALPWVVLIGCAGLSAHLCLTKALSLAPASIVMPIDFARLPIIAILGTLFYSEPLDLLVFVGAALIFGGNYLNITRSGR